MKEALAKYLVRRSIGLAVGDQQIAASVVAFTPLGWVESERKVEPFDPAQPEVALATLLEPWLDRSGRPRWPVLLGVPALRVFYTTRAIPASSVGATPQALLQEVLQTPNAGSDDMAVEMIKSAPGKRPLATFASCRRKYLVPLVTALVDRKARLTRAEPGPCALLRLAEARHRAPRGTKLAARVFLGTGQALAIVSAGQHPLLWRSFPLPAGAETQAILPALTALRMLARSCGIGLTPDAVLVHGRPDLGPLFDAEEFRARMDARLVRIDGPELDVNSVALGAALGVSQVGGTFDLARDMKPRASIREIFPMREAALQFALLYFASLFLWTTNSTIQRELAATQRSTAKFKWLGSTAEGQLVKDEKALVDKLDALEKFQSTRVDWNVHTQSVADWLPRNVSLTALTAFAELPTTSSKGGPKPKKSLVLHLSTPIPEHGAINQCLASLRRTAPLKRDFPTMKLADMKWASASGAKEPVATFSVVCEPGADATTGAKPEAKPKPASGGH
jgi:hypothetical protein